MTGVPRSLYSTGHRQEPAGILPPRRQDVHAAVPVEAPGLPVGEASVRGRSCVLPVRDGVIVQVGYHPDSAPVFHSKGFLG